MSKRIGSLVFLAFFLICPCGISRAAEPEVSMSLNRNEIVIGDSAILTITVRGLNSAEVPQVPAIPGFNVRFAGTRQESFSSFTMIVQGKQVKKESTGGGYNFDYELKPEKTGVFNIPSFPISIDGKIYRSRPFQINVIERSERGNDIFVEVEMDKRKVYLGEKILLTFKWYLNKDVGGYKINIPWLESMKNFLIAPPEADNNKRYISLMVNGDQQVAALKTRELYKGQPYTVISFQEILTPMAAGVYTLPPAFIKCEVITGYEKRPGRSRMDDFFDFDSDFSSIFGSGRRAITETVAVSSNPAEITVSEVPAAGRPETFNGAVGRFDFTVDVKPLTLKAGEPVTVTMKVSGSGNIEQVTLPVFPEMEGFKSYEPESKVDVSGSRGELSGEKVFEKVLIPKKEGDYRLPQISFTFFNPLMEKYQTISRGPFDLRVEKAEKEEEVHVVALTPQPAENNGENREIRILKQDIRYIKTSLGALVQPDEPMNENRGTRAACYVLPVIALAGLFVFQRRRERFRTDIGFARSRKALSNIRGFMKEAERSMEKQDTRGFYDALSKGMNAYLADKLNRAAGSIHPAIAEELADKGLDKEKTEAVRDLYRTFELVLFSSVSIDPGKLKSDYEVFKSVVSSLERIL
ncbi:MAG: BatD family protein [Candidatus Omnitrophota bacterium]